MQWYLKCRNGKIRISVIEHVTLLLLAVMLCLLTLILLNSYIFRHHSSSLVRLWNVPIHLKSYNAQKLILYKFCYINSFSLYFGVAHYFHQFSNCSRKSKFMPLGGYFFFPLHYIKISALIQFRFFTNQVVMVHEWCNLSFITSRKVCLFYC